MADEQKAPKHLEQRLKAKIEKKIAFFYLAVIPLFKFLFKFAKLEVGGVYRSHLGYIEYWNSLKCKVHASALKRRYSRGQIECYPAR